MRERLGWVVLALLALVTGYGFVVSGMRPETVWSEGGWQRFLVFGGLFGVLNPKLGSARIAETKESDIFAGGEEFILYIF